MVTPFSRRQLPNLLSGSALKLRILLIEPNHWLSTLLLDSLRKEQHSVDEIRDGLTARALALGSAYDVLIVGLADGTDLDLCRQIRADGSTIPMMALNHHAGVADVVAGLNAGADDYVTGSIALDELSARLRALVRRHRANSTLPVRGYGPLTLHK